MANVFDQFDAPTEAPADGNVFDKFDYPELTELDLAPSGRPGSLVDALQNIPAHMPSQFSSGMGPEVPVADNPDYQFTKATRGGLPGIVADSMGALQQKVVEPAGAAILNSLAKLGEGEAGIAPDKNPDDSFKPGEPIIPNEALPLATEKGIVPALTRALQGFTTPGSLITLPLAPESKLVQTGFMAGAASGIPDSLQKMANAKDPGELRDAATELGMNVGMAALMGKGISKETPEIPLGEPMTPEAAAANAEAVRTSLPPGFTPKQNMVNVFDQFDPPGRDLGVVQKENGGGQATPATEAAGSQTQGSRPAAQVNAPAAPAAPESPAAAPLDDFEQQVASIRSALSNPFKDTSGVQVLSPDGRPDPVQTAIARMKLEGKQGEMGGIPEQVANIDESALSETASNETPSEPTPPELQSEIPTSQPEAATAVPAAPVASDLSAGKENAVQPGTTATAASDPFTHPYRVGDKVIWQGQERTITRAIPGGDVVGIGKRAVKVSEIRPVSAAESEGSGSSQALQNEKVRLSQSSGNELPGSATSGREDLLPVAEESNPGQRTAQSNKPMSISSKMDTAGNMSRKAEQLALSLESLKTGIGKGGQLHAFGLAADLWDRAVSIAQGVIRAGGSVAEAVKAAIDHIHSNHSGTFDEGGARAALLKASGERPERERSADAVKAELETAKNDLQQAIRGDSAKTRKENQQSKALATAKYRGLRDELLHHPDYIAEQLSKQNAAVTEANAILKPFGKSVHPDDFPNPYELEGKLSTDQFKHLQDLYQQIQDSHGELMQMPKKMVARIHSEMQDDGRLPKSPGIADTGAGRTLDRMTQFLRENHFDSPKGTFAERLALGKRFADTVAGVKDTVTKAMLKSQAAWKAMVQSFKSPPLDDDYRAAKKSWISYDQRTAHEGYQYAKALTDRVPRKIRRMGMSVWLDAGGDEHLLRVQMLDVPEKYKPVWKAALELTPDEKRIALDVKANFAAKLDDAVATGLVEKGREDYGVPQRWKTAPETESAADPFGEEKKGSPGNPYAKLDPRDPFFSFSRKTPGYFEGIMAKGEPENLDIAHLVNVYDAAFHKALGSRGWIKSLADAKGRDGLPVVKISGSATTTRGETGATFVDARRIPKDAVTEDGRPYRFVDHFALKDWKFVSKDASGNPILVRGDFLVHPDYYRDVKNELETPRWTVEGLGGAALKASSFLKSSKFIGPFHIVTEALHAGTHGMVGMLQGITKGASPSVRGFEIDLKDPKQALLARNMVLGFGKARELFEEGLSSHGGIWSKVPGLGDAVVRMNHFTFNEYIPRLKMKVGLAVLERNLERYSKNTWEGKALTPEQIAELTGRQMDAAFGGQNWRLMGANKTGLAIMRLGLVAPDFLISRAKVIGQAFKPYNHEQRMFLLAQAIGVYTLCRVLNATFSNNHDPHFEFRNWDRVVIGNRGYAARFIVSDAANLARDLLGLGSFNQRGIPFITGRLGVVPKIAMETLSGKDLFTGQNKDGLFRTDNPLLKAFSIVAADTAEWMTPMGVDGFLPGAAKQGITEKGAAITALVGVSSRKESPANEIWDLARKFNLSSSDPSVVARQRERDNDSGAPSAYRGLNNLLDAGQLEKAKAEVQALQAGGKKLDTIISHYNRNVYFTGSASQEAKFISSLTPEQRKIYQAAKVEQQQRAATLRKALGR